VDPKKGICQPLRTRFQQFLRDYNPFLQATMTLRTEIGKSGTDRTSSQGKGNPLNRHLPVLISPISPRIETKKGTAVAVPFTYILRLYGLQFRF
jgi:hypothetical protein